MGTDSRQHTYWGVSSNTYTMCSRHLRKCGYMHDFRKVFVMRLCMCRCVHHMPLILTPFITCMYSEHTCSAHTEHSSSEVIHHKSLVLSCLSRIIKYECKYTPHSASITHQQHTGYSDGWTAIQQYNFITQIPNRRVILNPNWNQINIIQVVSSWHVLQSDWISINETRIANCKWGITHANFYPIIECPQFLFVANSHAELPFK